jgi:glycosyltransferase involved in cell wall biosynthesis
VRRVNIAPPPSLERFYYRFIHPLLRLVSSQTSFSLFRSRYHFERVKKLVACAERKYPTAEWNVFTTFSFAFRSDPARGVALVSDWSYEYYIRYFEQREPDPLERGSVAREQRQIAEGDVVVALFPKAATLVGANRRVYYLGNVVNIVGKVNGDVNAEKKRAGGRALFVGGKKYLEGARTLAQAVSELRRRGVPVECDIVGLTADDLRGFEEVVRCHGYLSKGNEAQRCRYYALLREAGVFVNPSPRWAGFSATLEAMFFGTPVVVAKYDEFVQCFGERLSFGSFLEGEGADALAKLVDAVLSAKNYVAMSNAARDAVSGSTWRAFSTQFLTLLTESAGQRGAAPMV